MQLQHFAPLRLLTVASDALWRWIGAGGWDRGALRPFSLKGSRLLELHLVPLNAVPLGTGSTFRLLRGGGGAQRRGCDSPQGPRHTRQTGPTLGCARGRAISEVKWLKKRRVCEDESSPCLMKYALPHLTPPPEQRDEHNQQAWLHVCRRLDLCLYLPGQQPVNCSRLRESYKANPVKSYVLIEGYVIFNWT